MGSIPAGCWSSLQPLGHFVWHWARQCTDSRFYIAALCIFFLGFSQWLTWAGRILTLDMNIRLPLSWNTWSQAGGHDLATCAGLVNGCEYSDCSLRASEEMSQKCLAHELLKILENKRLYQPSPSRLIPNTYNNIFHNIGLQVQINTCCVLIYVNTHQIHINTHHNLYQYIHTERKPFCWTKIWDTDMPLHTKYRPLHANTCHEYIPDAFQY